MNTKENLEVKAAMETLKRVSKEVDLSLLLYHDENTYFDISNSSNYRAQFEQGLLNNTKIKNFALKNDEIWLHFGSKKDFRSNYRFTNNNTIDGIIRITKQKLPIFIRVYSKCF